MHGRRRERENNNKYVPTTVLVFVPHVYDTREQEDPAAVVIIAVPLLLQVPRKAGDVAVAEETHHQGENKPRAV